MRVAVLHGSPRKKGNTELLLEEALRAVRERGTEVSFFNLNSMDIQGCQDCGGCSETGICVVKDDMGAIYEAVRECSRFIVASPVFFMGVSGQLKLVIDRAQAFWCGKYLLKTPVPAGPEGRKGLLILVGGMTKKDGAECAKACVRAFMRTINVPEHKELAYLGVDEKGAILKVPGALEKAYRAGAALVEE